MDIPESSLLKTSSLISVLMNPLLEFYTLFHIAKDTAQRKFHPNAQHLFYTAFSPGLFLPTNFDEQSSLPEK